MEVSFITLYKNQPTFGDIDRELRKRGFIPHRFISIKNWSISPTIRGGEPRFPYNQLLEADVVYVRDITRPATMTTEQLMKLAAIAHYVYASPDLTARCLLELQSRGSIASDVCQEYYASLGSA